MVQLLLHLSLLPQFAQGISPYLFTFTFFFGFLSPSNVHLSFPFTSYWKMYCIGTTLHFWFNDCVTLLSAGPKGIVGSPLLFHRLTISTFYRDLTCEHFPPSLFHVSLSGLSHGEKRGVVGTRPFTLRIYCANELL